MINPLRRPSIESSFSRGLGLTDEANHESSANLAKSGLSSVSDMLANRKVLEGEKALMEAQRYAGSGSGLNNALNMVGGILGGFKGSFGGGSSSSGFSLGNSFTKDYGLGSQIGSGLSNLSSYWNG